MEIMNGDNGEPMTPLCNSYSGMGKMSDQREMVFFNNKTDGFLSPSTNNNTINWQHENESSFCGNYLAPGVIRSRCASSVASDSNSNTISVHAESIAAVKVDRMSHNSINSRTSLSLMINSPGGDCIRTKTFVGIDYVFDYIFDYVFEWGVWGGVG